MKSFFLPLLVVCSFTTLLTAQVHPIEVHSNNRVASILLSPSEYSSWIATNGFGNPAQRDPIVQDIYKKFEDDFDFIFFVLNEDTVPSNLPFGQFASYSNHDLGIGKPTYDATFFAGSAGRLKGALHLTSISFLRFGPALHEVLHNWANDAIDTETISELGTDITSSSLPAHWGFTGGSNKGQLGGFDQNTLVVNDDGSYSLEIFGANANGGNTVPYTDFELYLMGMIDVTEVADFDVFRNINSASFDEETETLTITGDRETYTPESIVSRLGERIPSAADSQKDFKALVVIITDKEVGLLGWGTVDNHAMNFEIDGPDAFQSSYNFWEATRGLGTLEMGNIDQSLSTDEFNFQELINIFPVPAQDIVNIRINESKEINTILLYNTLGQLVKEFKYDNTSNDFTIDVSSYNSGLYFLHFRNDTQFLGAKQLIISK